MTALRTLAEGNRFSKEKFDVFLDEFVSSVFLPCRLVASLLRVWGCFAAPCTTRP